VGYLVTVFARRRQFQEGYAMADKNVPMIELHCTNGKCARTFRVELGSFVENKRRADCPHCFENDIYDLKKGTLLK
jgi:hypothetical protein